MKQFDNSRRPRAQRRRAATSSEAVDLVPASAGVLDLTRS